MSLFLQYLRTNNNLLLVISIMLSFAESNTWSFVAWVLVKKYCWPLILCCCLKRSRVTLWETVAECDGSRIKLISCVSPDLDRTNLAFMLCKLFVVPRVGRKIACWDVHKFADTQKLHNWRARKNSFAHFVLTEIAIIWSDLTRVNFQPVVSAAVFLVWASCWSNL